MSLNALSRVCQLCFAGAVAALFSVTTTQNAAAQMTATASEVIFLVDESGSMGGEQAFLPGFVNDLDTRLSANGVTTRSYGLVGFGGGGVGNLGRLFQVDGMQLGSAAGFGTAAGMLQLTGAFEDGFSAIDFATSTYPDPATGVRRTLVLVTDEDRDNGNNALTAMSVVTDLNNRGINLVSVINGNIQGSMGEQALATDGTNAFIQNGTTFTTVPLGSTAGAGTTDADYIQTALSTPNGCAADLNQLRAGGDTATAFAEIFLQCLLFAITGGVAAPPPTANNLFLNVYVDNAHAIMNNIQDQIGQMIEIDISSEIIQTALASASDDAQIVRDILGVSGLRAYLILDFMTGDHSAFGNNKKFDYNGGGTIVGLDYTFGNSLGMGEDITVGGAVAYHSLSNSVTNPLGGLDTRTVSGTLYGAVKMPDGIYGKATAQVSFSNYEQRRISGGALFGGTTDGIGLLGEIEAGIEFKDIVIDADKKLHLTPFASIAIDNRSVEGFQETNGGLLIGDFDQTSLIGKIGGRATLTIDIDDETMFFVSGDIAAAYDFLDDDELALINNGAQPNERIEAIDDISAQYGAMIGFDFTRDSSLFLSYNGGFSANTLQHAFSGGAVINF